MKNYNVQEMEDILPNFCVVAMISKKQCMLY